MKQAQKEMDTRGLRLTSKEDSSDFHLVTQQSFPPLLSLKIMFFFTGKDDGFAKMKSKNYQ